MIVLDEEHYLWHLLEEDGRLYLNAICSHSAVDYYFLMEMSSDEVDQFRLRGRTYLDKLAYQIHYSAPGVIGSKSPFKARSLLVTHAERRDEAVEAWEAARSGAP